MKNPQKGFIGKLLIIIIAVLLIAWAAYVYYHDKAQVQVAENGSLTASTTDVYVESITYQNAQYGFSLTLSNDWKGYTVQENKWQGVIDGGTDKQTTDQGPLISIHHPHPDVVGQPIPIMVFTISQWNMVTNETGQGSFMSVGAAPIPPSEVGRNSKYVFAIPARYNYGFPPGYQETDNIINTKSNWSFFDHS